MDRYENRHEAGRILADFLQAYAHHPHAIVLALPRGGVPVAYEIASALELPLDVFIVRKIGMPGYDELALGAIAMGDVQVFNDDIIREYQVPAAAIQTVIENETNELKRRALTYRGDAPFPALEGKTVILVDDGIATGATIRAAIKALRLLKPAKIIAAVPVAEKYMCERLESIVDELICPLRPTNFRAVGNWYEDFGQTEDAEVHALLKEANQ